MLPIDFMIEQQKPTTKEIIKVPKNEVFPPLYSIKSKSTVNE